MRLLPQQIELKNCSTVKLKQSVFVTDDVELSISLIENDLPKKIPLGAKFNAVIVRYSSDEVVAKLDNPYFNITGENKFCLYLNSTLTKLEKTDSLVIYITVIGDFEDECGHIENTTICLNPMVLKVVYSKHNSSESIATYILLSTEEGKILNTEDGKAIQI